MTCAEWKILESTIESHLSSGRWLKKRVNIEGDEVEFTSISQVIATLNYVKSRISECESGLKINTSVGFRTKASYGGNGLR